MTLHFHDLQPAPEGTEVVTVPPELRTEMDRRWSEFHLDREVTGEPIDVAAFFAKGPAPWVRHGLLVRVDHLDGTPEDNVAAIQRTAPEGWEVTCRLGTV